MLRNKRFDLPLAFAQVGCQQLGSSLGYKALPTTLFYDGQGRLAAVRAGELSAATLADNLALISSPMIPMIPAIPAIPAK